ncbi:MAG: fimbrillin family protein [Bacteroidales bacterium]|nr:fimbrillin family protein [Bacteroidales bacterium]
MLKRVTFILAAVFTLALSAVTGCVKAYDPAPEQGNAIRFVAGSLLLVDDAPYSKATLTDNFGDGSTFAVFGDRVISGENAVVFGGTNGVTVTASDHDSNPATPLVWSYTPLHFWYWESSGDWYDFAAVSPAGMGTTRMDIAGNVAISTHYDITSQDYDLLGATYRRRGSVQDPNGTVPLNFTHLASAVCVKVLNNSETSSVTVDRIKFNNLVVEGDAKVTLDHFGNAENSWINTERNTEDVRVFEPSPSASVAAGGNYVSPFWVMIPERLDQAAAAGGLEEDMPKLILYYTPSSSGIQKSASITLKDVCPRDSDTPISTWAMGTKYTYEVSMRLDEGVLVNITTTDWGETIEAETPGLLIQ